MRIWQVWGDERGRVLVWSGGRVLVWGCRRRGYGLEHMLGLEGVGRLEQGGADKKML